MRSDHLPRAAVLAAACALFTRAPLAQAPPGAFFQPLRDTAPAPHYEAYAPAECLAAVVREGAAARRTSPLRPDDVWQLSFLENDTVVAAQRRAASVCARRYAVGALAAVEPRDLPDLARLYWFAGDLAAARRAAGRAQHAGPTDSARASASRRLLTRFLLSQQRDAEFVSTTVLPALDSLRSLPAQDARFQAHTALAYTFASSRRPGAGDSVRAHIDAAVREFAGMPAALQAVLVDTAGPLLQLGAAEATETGDTARARALLDQARRLLPKLPDGADYVHRAEAVVRYFGMTAPPIHADRVYGAPPGQSPAGPWPRPGRWALVAPMPTGSYMAGFYRNLRKTLGDSVDIVFYTPTRGYWRPRGSLTPAEEGALSYDYVSRRWSIPGTLLVETRGFHPLPDGRRIPEQTITPGLYQNTGVVVDPRGTIRAMVDQATLVRFDLLVASLMRRDAAAGRP